MGQKALLIRNNLGGFYSDYNFEPEVSRPQKSSETHPPFADPLEQWGCSLQPCSSCPEQPQSKGSKPNDVQLLKFCSVQYGSLGCSAILCRVWRNRRSKTNSHVCTGVFTKILTGKSCGIMVNLRCISMGSHLKSPGKGQSSAESEGIPTNQAHDEDLRALLMLHVSCVMRQRRTFTAALL